MMIGVVCGLIPLAVGLSRDRMVMGLAGFVLCILAGFALSALGALPMASLASLAIAIAGRPAKKAQSPEVTSPPEMQAPEQKEV
ncbi:MAG TPA: hypothetical protein VGY53_00620 [Isosphaeraceae bacterium]|nr:hypothetical protein [Isosphaeraceae bacterium]